MRYGGVVKLLSKYYPNDKWELNGNVLAKPSTSISKFQMHLYKTLQAIFFPPTSTTLSQGDIKINEYYHRLQYSDTGGPFQFDILIESLGLAFEAHGEHHYYWHFLHGDPMEQQARDEEKRTKSKQHGITLIEVFNVELN